MHAWPVEGLQHWMSWRSSSLRDSLQITRATRCEGQLGAGRPRISDQARQTEVTTNEISEPVEVHRVLRGTAEV